MKKSEVSKIAELARLELSQAELDEITPQLDSILDYIKQLEKIETTGVEPTAQVTGQVNVLRKDAVSDWTEDERVAALEQAPGGLSDNKIKVKKVL